MRGNRSQYRLIKRCIFFFSTIALLPLALIYFIVSDQIYRTKNQDVSKQKNKCGLKLGQILFLN